MKQPLVIAFLLLATLQTRALAQSDEARARASYVDGQTHVDAEEYDLAHEDFETGYVLSRRPLFLYNMAECSLLGGHTAVARREYERYLELEPEGTMAAVARERIQEMQTEVDLRVNDVPEPPNAQAVNFESGAPHPPRRRIATDWRLWTVVAAVVVAGAAVGAAVGFSRAGGSDCDNDCFIIDRSGS